MKKLFAFLAATFLLASAVTAWAGDVALPKDLSGYRHIGSRVIPDKNSPLFGIHHFYMNKTGQAAFQKGAAYPKGTIIVGVVYEVVTMPDGALDEGKKLFHTYMKKDASAKETGGWVFAAFGPDGKPMQKDVKTDCFACHTAVRDTDYVFSKPLK